MFPHTGAVNGAGRDLKSWTCPENSEASYGASHSQGQAWGRDTVWPPETEGKEPQISHHWVSSSVLDSCKTPVVMHWVLGFWVEEQRGYISPKNVGQMSWVCA